jgi:F-type H+-transporting ATPase subunit b
MDLLNFTLIGETITFIVLVWFTMKYIWPPLTRAINERQQKIAEGLEAGERGRLNLELSQQQAIRIIGNAKQEANKIIEQANAQVVDIIEQGKIKAETEGERLLRLAQGDIEHERESVKLKLQEQTMLQATMIAEKILKSKLDETTNIKLIEQFLAEVSGD